MVLRRICLAFLIAAVAAAPASAGVETIALPPTQEQGLDMIIVDADAMPPEPELAASLPEVEDVSWSGAPIDLLKPVHHVYTDLRRQLARYRGKWAALPQVRIPVKGPLMAPGSTDARVPVLRQRLGLAPAGGFDPALETAIAEFQRAHGLPEDGKAGTETLAALNRGAAHYERLILLNMERARRLPTPDAAGRYILVDTGAARLWLYENGRAVDSMKVIVGTAASATPMMAAVMRYVSINPYWNVPFDLVRKTIAPRVLTEGVAYLKSKRYEVLDSWEADARVIDPLSVDWGAVANGDRELRIRQLPGPGNFMGDIKFMMPNEYGIYLHDTPGKVLFNEENRWLSNGCIRVEDAQRLARWLFREMPRAPSPDSEYNVPLPQPVPVYVTYLTVGSDARGLTFRTDHYGRDAALLARFEAEGDGMSEPDKAMLASVPRPAAKPLAGKKAEPASSKAAAAAAAAAAKAARAAKLAEKASTRPAVKATPAKAQAGKAAKLAAKPPPKATSKAAAGKAKVAVKPTAGKTGPAKTTAKSAKAAAAKPGAKAGTTTALSTPRRTPRS